MECDSSVHVTVLPEEAGFKAVSPAPVVYCASTNSFVWGWRLSCATPCGRAVCPAEEAEVLGRPSRGGDESLACFPMILQASCVQYRVVVRDVRTLQILQLYTCLDQVQHMEWSADSLFILCAMYKRGLVQVSVCHGPRGGHPRGAPEVWLWGERPHCCLLPQCSQGHCLYFSARSPSEGGPCARVCFSLL